MTPPPDDDTNGDRGHTHFEVPLLSSLRPTKAAGSQAQDSSAVPWSPRGSELSLEMWREAFSTPLQKMGATEGQVGGIQSQTKDDDIEEGDLPEHKRPSAPIDFSQIDPGKPESILKMTKKGKTLMMFVTVSGSPTEKETEEITSLWQGSLFNANYDVQRFIVGSDRAIFMLRDGSYAWEIKDFLFCAVEGSTPFTLPKTLYFHLAVFQRQNVHVCHGFLCSVRLLQPVLTNCLLCAGTTRNLPALRVTAETIASVRGAQGLAEIWEALKDFELHWRADWRGS
ncbi:hypothetical protein CB1_001254009 [Camelus ferus]|nr:hypothetical protein CB1_001254009 [Camelus ferus]